MPANTLRSYARPAEDYEAAVARIETLQARDTFEINPLSHTRFLTHGQKTDRVVVWFHGYTNSPAEFAVLGQRCFEQGCNVLIPRAPHHGLLNRMNTETEKLTAEELAQFTDEAVNIACGLGRQVIVGGLSMGGVLTAWAAQQRDEISLALILSPAFGVEIIPARLTELFSRATLLLPNRYRWWDEQLKDTPLEPMHAYPRFAMHGLAQIMRLGFNAQHQARHGKPAARRVWVITNANDHSVNNQLTTQIVQSWKSSGADNVRTYTFPAELGLQHDFVEATSATQKIESVYPVLLGIINDQCPPQEK